MGSKWSSTHSAAYHCEVHVFFIDAEPQSPTTESRHLSAIVQPLAAGTTSQQTQDASSANAEAATSTMTNICSFCKLDDPPASTPLGELLHFQSKEQRYMVHRECAMWAPLVFQVITFF